VSTVKTVRRQDPARTLSGLCQDSVRTMSGLCQDSVRTVRTVAGAPQTRLGTATSVKKLQPDGGSSTRLWSGSPTTPSRTSGGSSACMCQAETPAETVTINQQSVRCVPAQPPSKPRPSAAADAATKSDQLNLASAEPELSCGFVAQVMATNGRSARNGSGLGDSHSNGHSNGKSGSMAESLTAGNLYHMALEAKPVLGDWFSIADTATRLGLAILAFYRHLLMQPLALLRFAHSWNLQWCARAPHPRRTRARDARTRARPLAAASRGDAPPILPSLAPLLPPRRARHRRRRLLRRRRRVPQVWLEGRTAHAVPAHPALCADGCRADQARGRVPAGGGAGLEDEGARPRLLPAPRLVRRLHPLGLLPRRLRLLGLLPPVRRRQDGARPHPLR